MNLPTEKEVSDIYENFMARDSVSSVSSIFENDKEDMYNYSILISNNVKNT